MKFLDPGSGIPTYELNLWWTLQFSLRIQSAFSDFLLLLEFLFYSLLKRKKLYRAAGRLRPMYWLFCELFCDAYSNCIMVGGSVTKLRAPLNAADLPSFYHNSWSTITQMKAKDWKSAYCCRFSNLVVNGWFLPYQFFADTLGWDAPYAVSSLSKLTRYKTA